MVYWSAVPELAHFALALGGAAALAQGATGLAGAALAHGGLMRAAAGAARLQTAALLAAFLGLGWAFLAKDFSVAYVARHANAALPWHYRLSAVWGGHEGSLLLWALLLAGWGTAVSAAQRHLPLAFAARVLGVLGLVGLGFAAFLLFTSNPFERLLPAPVDGADLNPLLQDPGLVLHPPLLYMGYVGLAVPFAFAVAALLEGRIDTAWTRWTRPWTLAAWTFLTLGIALGSWWAYYELGWGGWWFWDPVENASFMPWLLATALLHSLAVTEQRGAFKAWTLLLAVFGFSLSLLGTFLVRSGVLVSVHAFANDPARGLFILAFLALVVGAALALYAARAGRIVDHGRFGLLSRETLLLLNNVLLLVAAFSILLGTLYPILGEALGWGKISVGPPYFNAVFVPLMTPLLLLLPLGPLTRWGEDTLARLGRRVARTLLFSLLLGAGVLLLTAGPAPAGVTLAALLAAWIAGGSLRALLAALPERRLAALGRVPLRHWGMVAAHVGVAVTTLGVAVASHYGQSEHVRMAVGERYALAGYEFELRALETVPGPNYQAQRAQFAVYRDGREVARLAPEKRHYFSQEKPMTEAGIDAGLLRDLYVSLAEPLPDGAWAVQLAYKPLVRWIWLGALFMALGGALAAADRRYRKRA